MLTYACLTSAETDEDDNATLLAVTSTTTRATGSWSIAGCRLRTRTTLSEPSAAGSGSSRQSDSSAAVSAGRRTSQLLVAAAPNQLPDALSVNGSEPVRSMSMLEYGQWAIADDPGPLTNTVVRLQGFVVPRGDDGWYLSPIRINCGRAVGGGRRHVGAASPPSGRRLSRAGRRGAVGHLHEPSDQPLRELSAVFTDDLDSRLDRAPVADQPGGVNGHGHGRCVVQHRRQHR
jgi:hypothetical protein